MTINPPPVLALVRDLIFATRISTVARAGGTEVKIIRDSAQLANQPGRLLIVDLNMEGAIEAASAWRAASGGQVVGFVSHVDADMASRAKSSGIDRVLARSRFVQVLPELLSTGTLPK